MVDFKFPDVGEGITEGQIIKWHVKEGDTVKEDDTLLEVETDKAVVEIPSPTSGKVTKIKYSEGDTINVGDVICVIAGKGAKDVSKKIQEQRKPRKSTGVVGELEEAPEEPSSEKTEAKAKSVTAKPATEKSVKSKSEETKPAKSKKAEAKTQKEPAKDKSKPSMKKGKAKALPKVRKYAKVQGVDIDYLHGTGPGGRVTMQDVKSFMKTKKPSKEAVQAEKKGVQVGRQYDKFGYFENIPMTGIRKSIAKKMTESAYTAPHVWHMDEADVTKLWNIRKKEKARAEKKGYKLTFLPFIIRAVIGALKEHPRFNGEMDDENEEFIVKKYYNIGIAVETEHGLMVPNIKKADNKSLLGLSKEIVDLAGKAKEKKLGLDDMKSGTFTITNIGSIGGKYATPIINYPESAILGVMRIYDKPVVVNGHVKVRKMMGLSLGFDHRIVDGAEAARFMNSIKEHLEDPMLLVIES